MKRRGTWLLALGLGVTTAACSTADSSSTAGGAGSGSGGSGAAGASAPSAGSGTGESGSGGAGGSTGGGASGAAPTAGAGASSGAAGSAQAGTDAGGAPSAGAGGVGNSAGAASGAGGSGGVPAGGAAGSAALGCDWENPAGRVVLFDGTSLAAWRNARTGAAAHWRAVDGTMEVVPVEPPTDLVTATGFEDLCVHLEYLTPSYPASVRGQERGNSGIYLKHAYEMQILDSAGAPAAIDSCGAIYSVAAPLEVACNPELVWNTYEIEFKSSVWNDAGTKTESAMVVASRLNGRLVQSRVALNPPGGATTAGEPDSPGPKPLMLQDHRNLVRFRNIWLKVPHYERTQRTK